VTAVINNDINILPNPNKGGFAIVGSMNLLQDEKLSVTVINMLGQVIYKSMVNTQAGNFRIEIQLNNLSSGMYLMHVTGEGENDVLRFMVEQ
jgi:hypothetical protein